MAAYQITGIFAPVPTPFDANGEVAYDHFAQNTRRFGQTTLDGILVLGSNGEAVSLREEEKIKLMHLAREHFPAEKKVIAGTGCESLQTTLALCRAAKSAGADAVLVINPTYYRGYVSKPEAMLDYFLKVADSSPLPVMIYNMPRNTGINIPASVISKASRHENIIGMKDSGGDIAQIASIIQNSVPGFSVFAGSASFLLPTLYLGGCGGTLATANVAPSLCTDMLKAFQAGDHEKARAIQLSILKLNAAVTSGYGIPGLKYALECLGYYGGPCRSPLREAIGEEAKADLRAMMAELNLI